MMFRQIRLLSKALLTVPAFVRRLASVHPFMVDSDCFLDESLAASVAFVRFDAVVH